ncbi:hypothetical protein SLE2022_277830 [Rubroshorea leprosula]
MYPFKPSFLNTLRSLKNLKRVEPRRFIPSTNWDIAVPGTHTHGLERHREAEHRKTLDGITHLSIPSLNKIATLEEEVLPLVLSHAINYIAFAGKETGELQISLPFLTKDKVVKDAMLYVKIVDPCNPPSYAVDDPIFEVTQLVETMGCILGKLLSDETVVEFATNETLLVLTSKKEQEKVISRALEKKVRRFSHRELMRKKYWEGMVEQGTFRSN